jgi:hypothetical protein
LSFSYETSDRTYYLNISAIDAGLPGGEASWLVQNLPLLPKEDEDDSRRRQAVDLSLLTLIAAPGQPCPDLLINTTVDMFPRTEPPSDPSTLIVVSSLERHASDSIDEAPDPGPFTNAGVPSGIKNYGVPTRFGQRRDLDEVQEGMNQSFAGSCARNWDWLNRQYDLDMALSAQGIFDNLLAAGVSLPNLDGSMARDQWIARADSLARELTSDRMVTAVWDPDGHVDPIAGIAEDSESKFWDWLLEQLELGHAVQVAYYHPGLPQVVSVTAAYRGGVRYFLQFRDDEDQSVMMGDERGDRFSKDTNLYVDSNDFFFGRDGVPIYYAICSAPDCNQNGISDGRDIATGTSPDANDNGIPDECELVAVEDEPSHPPHNSLRLAVAPNPFNPATEISFSLVYSGPVRLEIFDLRGRRVTTLAEGEFAAGEHTVPWSGRDERDATVASGTYYVRLACADDVKVRKLTLLK